MDEVPRAFAISDIPPPLEMKGRVYASCVRSSMTYGSETRPLLVDVGLKFERGEFTAHIVDPVVTLSCCSALSSTTSVSQKGQVSEVGFTSDITILTRYNILKQFINI